MLIVVVDLLIAWQLGLDARLVASCLAWPNSTRGQWCIFCRYVAWEIEVHRWHSFLLESQITWMTMLWRSV